MDEKKALVLIGMPGAGKSTFGRAAAEAEGAAFLDTDELLALREGKSLPEILQGGPERFRAAEEAALLSLEAADGIVATGGSAVFSTAGMKRLKRLGTIVFLHVPVEEISRRIGDGKSRGVVARDGHGVSQQLTDESVRFAHPRPRSFRPTPRHSGACSTGSPECRDQGKTRRDERSGSA